MINDMRWLQKQEQPLDAWLFDMIAQINETVYVIISQINLAIDEVEKDVS